MTTLYLIDRLNNNKVIGEFDNLHLVGKHLNDKEYSENWENEAETFQEWKEDNFFTVTSDEMKEAVRLYGGRRKNYWN
jgi:hypothetical protein